MIVQNLNFGLPNNYTLTFVIKPKMNAFVQSSVLIILKHIFF